MRAAIRAGALAIGMTVASLAIPAALVFGSDTVHVAVGVGFIAAIAACYWLVFYECIRDE